MKHPKLPTRLFLAAITCLLCSCAGMLSFLASPAGQTVVQLADLGLTVAAAKGKIKPGDSIALQKGLAIVSSPGSALSKAFSYTELGISEAVRLGKLKPGDALVVQGVVAVIKPALLPVTAAKNPGTL